VLEYVEKKLTATKLSTSCLKEEDKVYQDTSIMKYEFKLGQPIMFHNSKIKLFHRRLKTKWSSLWVVQEIRTNGNIEIENPYSKRVKVVTMKMLQ